MPSISTNQVGASSNVKNKSPTLPERVAQFYYSHGLFCSSYPFSVISFAVTVALICCYPLLNLPLPGNMPHQVVWPKNSSNLNSTEPNLPYTWVKSDTPFFYIQQILIRSAVLPWSNNLVLIDAFRGPLYEVFKILEIIRNHQDENSMKTLSHLCLHVESVKKKSNKKIVMPEYSCLVLSPANLWQNNLEQFSMDSNILGTVYNHQNYQKGKISMAEILFGVNLKDAGIKRYPIRHRQRIIQYSITVIFKDYDALFISSLKEKLHRYYPLHQKHNNVFNNSELSDDDGEVVYIYYPSDFNYYEFVPLIIAFILLFLYVYFSVRKIDLVTSKFFMAISAVSTVFLCLLMSVGLCFFFGLTLSLQGKEIFPYLVILIGLENVLVLTKSVVSTPQHLDVKIRLAQGLSKEGWSITKNLLIELTILTIGLFTFIPAVQEFCIFAIAGLISDFFLQMFFFSTVLGIDIRRTELTQLQTFKQEVFQNSLYANSNGSYEKHYSLQRIGLNRSKSHPRLTNAHTNVVAGQAQTGTEKKIPKRLRLVHIWARTRFFQRGFMILMIVWISILVYDSGIIEHFVESNTFNDSQKITVDDSIKPIVSKSVNVTEFITRNLIENYTSKLSKAPDSLVDKESFSTNINSATNMFSDSILYIDNKTDDLIKLKHTEFSPLRKLSSFHWPAILHNYNISLSGKYIMILPHMRISHVVSPEEAILLRNPEENSIKNFQWSALAAALDPLDFSDTEHLGSSSNNFAQHVTPYYPTSPMEIMLTTMLCIISVVVLAYGTVVLYRCICTRNYAEWRASWYSENAEEPVTQLVMEAVPVSIDGHSQQVECLVTDGSHIVSSCLAGHIKVWDSVTAELLATIDRKVYFGCDTPQTSYDTQLETEEVLLSDYESGSPPSRDEFTTYSKFILPSLQQKINTKFAGCKLEPLSFNSENKFYDFSASYNNFFLNGECNKSNNVYKRNKSETATWVLKNNVSNILDKSPSSSSVFSVLKNSEKINSDVSDCEKVSDINSTLSYCNREMCTNKQEQMRVPAIWCMDYVDNLIAIGCANGRVEFWEGTTGNFKCLFEDGMGVGITSIKIIANRVIAAKLNGSLDFLLLESYSQGRQIDWSFTSAYRRTHARSGSTGSLGDCRDMKPGKINTEDLRCIRLNLTRAHQQPINVLESEGGRVLTGSQDHTLKVFRLEDQVALYTLHGHCGPITCLFIDRISPMMSGSGSQDGLLCVWDLMTGACMYSIQAHDGSITSLTYSASYVISLGSDERLCVWERFQGHLLNTIHVSHTYATSMVMLTQCLLVTARGGSLAVWDVRSGETVRRVPLGNQDRCIHVRQVLLLPDANSVVCDYSKQLRVVRFPLVHDKFE